MDAMNSRGVKAGRSPRDHLVPHLTEEETEALKSPKSMQLLNGEVGLQT